MTPSYALVYTCFGWDEFTQAQYNRNADRCKSGQPHVIVDESRGLIAIPDHLRKTSATTELARNLGLRIAYDRSLFWHNLDYLQYIFLHAFPDFEYYVFLDYDAIIDANIDELIEKVHALHIDHAAEPVREQLSDWVYMRQHRPIYGELLEKGAIMAVTILSKTALRHLYARRVSMSRSLPTGAFWPMCEAFMTTELKAARFKRASLDQFGSVEAFAWWPPTLDESFVPAGKPTFVHPVLDRSRFIASMVKHSPGRHFLLPTSRLWRAVYLCPDKRWGRLICLEMWARLKRRVCGHIYGDINQGSFGMKWT